MTPSNGAERYNRGCPTGGDRTHRSHEARWSWKMMPRRVRQHGRVVAVEDESTRELLVELRGRLTQFVAGWDATVSTGGWSLLPEWMTVCQRSGSSRPIGLAAPWTSWLRMRGPITWSWTLPPGTGAGSSCYRSGPGRPGPGPAVPGPGKRGCRPDPEGGLESPSGWDARRGDLPRPGLPRRAVAALGPRRR